MSEENQVVQGEENQKVETQQQEATPQYSEVELKALDMGWRPKEEFDGDEHDFIDAQEFVRRKPLFDKIEGQSRQLKEVTKALNALKAHHEKVRESEYKRALDDLRTQKAKALEDGDAQKLITIDENIADLKVQQQVEKQQNVNQAKQPDPRFVQWVNTNQWYTKDNEMREFADGIGMSHAKNNPDKSPEEVLDYVVSRVKKAFPEKFQNPNRNKPSAVESSSTSTPSRQQKKVDDDFELSDEEKKVMNNFIRTGVMTKEEYITEIKRFRG